MSYVDGFVAAVPNANKEIYRQHAKKGAAIFRKYGALQMVECWGDEVPDGELTSFPKAVQCKADESVIFSWILWPSKSVRDAGMKKAMEDPLFDMENNPMPFDGQRLIYGGFEMLLDA